jgi:hypothetical protein
LNTQKLIFSITKRINPIKNGEGLGIDFFQRRYTYGSKYMSRTLVSLAIREIQIKTTMKYYFLLTRIPVI